MSQSVFIPHMLPRRRSLFGAQRQLASEARPDLLLFALSVMIATYVWRFQDLFPIVGALRTPLIAAALSIALFMLDRHPARRVGHLKMPILFYSLALLGIATLGVATSLWPRRSATFLLTDFVPNLVLMGMLAASVRGMRDLEWIILVNVLCACLFSLFVHSRVGPSGRFGDDLIYYDANDLALVMVCTIPFAIFFLVRGPWTYRALALFALVLFVATLAKSDSRGGFLGFVAVLAYVLVSYRAIPKRVRLLAAGGGFALLAVLASDSYWEDIRTLRNPQQDYNWSGRAPEGRVEVWRRGIRYMTAHPFLGVGLQNFPIAEGKLSKEAKARAERGAGFKWSAAHNSFIEIGAELGVIALALFVAMFVSAFRALGKIIKSVVRTRDQAMMRAVALACSLSASLVGFVVSGFFLSTSYFSYLYVLLALVMGLIKVSRILARRPPAGVGWQHRADAEQRLVWPAAAHAAGGEQRQPRRHQIGHRPFRPIRAD